MDLQKVLKYITIGGLFLLPLTALVVADSLFFPYITGKNFFMRIVVEIIFFAWVLLALLNSAYRPKWSHLLSASALFVGIMAVADAFGTYPLRSIWSTFERMDGLMVLLHLFAYLLVLVSVLRTPNIWRRLWTASVAISVVLGIHALFQYFGASEVAQGGTRVDATLGNPIYLGGYMLVHIFITLWLLWDLNKKERDSKDIWLLGFYIIALALQTSALFFSQTRGSILGLVGGGFLAALLIAVTAKRHPRIRKASIGVVLAIVLMIGGFFALKDSDFVRETPVLNRFAEISLSEGTGWSRLVMWEIAMDGFWEKPILGWGQEGFIDVFNKHYRPELYEQESWFDRPHNIVLSWLVAGGALGALAYLSIWAMLLWGIWSRKNDLDRVEQSLLTGLLAGYFFHNLFVFDSIVTHLLFFSLIGFVHFKSRGVREEEGVSLVKQSLVIPVSAVLVLLLAFGIYFINIRPLQASKDILMGLKLARSNPEQALEHLTDSREHGFLGEFEGAIHIGLTANSLRDTQISDELKGKYLEKTEKALMDEIEANPSGVRARFFLGLVLSEFGEQSEAIKYLEEARSLSPKKQRILMELGEAYMKNGDIQKAGEIFHEAYELDTSFVELRQGVAMVALLEGEFEEARNAIYDEDGNVVLLSRELISTAINTGANEIARDLLEEFVRQNANNPQSFASAAAGFVELGDRARAIEVLRLITEIDAGFETEVNRLIGEIESGGNPLGQ
jgi:O-antigen ligase